MMVDFIMPEKGYGDFQEHYDACHIAVHELLIECNPHWAVDGITTSEYEDEHDSTCDVLSRKYIIKYIESLGYTIIYPE